MNNEYKADDIQVLEGLDAVRKRPGMYIGSTSSRGLHHLVWEIVDNAIDEALAGYSDDIEIIINKDGSITIKDDGRGIPTGVHGQTGISTVETVYTILHAGGKFGGGSYKVSGGLHGVGAAVVNALSKWVDVTVYQDSKIFNVRFENGGQTVKPLEVIGKCDPNRTGTTVSFMPDVEIFKEGIEFDYELLKIRARELAFLTKGLKIILIDDRHDKKEEFLYEGGIAEYIELLHETKTPIFEEVVHFEGESDDVIIEVAFQYNTGFSEGIYSFVNNITTPEGGTHEDGVKLALTRIINNYARNNNILRDNDDNLSGDDVREGITMIISAKIPDPQFEGQTKTKLGNSEVRRIANSIFSTHFERFLLENPTEARQIVEKGIAASRARVAARRARELTRKTGDLDTINTWGKLTNCSSKIPEEKELFIVEGDSAGGTAKGGRNPRTQAILPLRGKILNVEKARLERILANEEIRSLISAIGTGIGDEFDITKLNFHKIILMTDADVDGAHIDTLLLTFFYRFFKPLVEAGHVYLAQPPLYSVKHGKTIKYALDDEEKDEYIASLPKNARYDLQRMKGLGEMNASELSETTMDVDTRTLIQVTVDDAIIADQTFDMLMGDDVAPRRKFIEENAIYVENLDI